VVARMHRAQRSSTRTGQQCLPLPEVGDHLIAQLREATCPLVWRNKHMSRHSGREIHKRKRVF
jgi:hypothetical protein